MEKATKGFGGVFQFFNKKTGDRFIGSSPSISNKFGIIFSLLCNGLYSNVKMQEEWNVHGPESFEFSILEIVSNKQLLCTKTREHLRQCGGFSLDRGNEYVVSGYISVSRDIKDELESIKTGTFDKTIQELLQYFLQGEENKL